MRFGLSIPNFADFGEPATMVELAGDAEAAGWDGFFVWDHVRFTTELALPVYDPWVLLAAVATATERMSIGPMVTPLARRRPAKLARETVTLDHLAAGRVVFGVGLGEPADGDFTELGDEGDPRVRAEMLDEGLHVVTRLWSGEPPSHVGVHYRAEGQPFLPRPLQEPRIPIWVAGAWPRRPAFRRAARWDGVFPIVIGGPLGYRGPTPEELADIAGYVGEHRVADGPFDLVSSGSSRTRTPDIAAYVDVGATWWIEHVGGPGVPLEEWQELIRRGPPPV